MSYRDLIIISIFLSGGLFCCRQPSDQGAVKRVEDSQLAHIVDLNGRWAKSDTSNIAFSVDGDTVYMFEDPVGVFFEAKQDSFVYYFDSTKFSSRVITIRPDTLVLVENGDTIRLFKMR